MPFDHFGKFVAPPRLVDRAGLLSLHRAVYTASTRAALRALAAELRHDGLVAVVQADGSRWVFSAASTAADTTNNLVMTPDGGTGRWLRADSAVHLKLAIGFATADAAVLFTVPTGFRLELERLWWEITTNFTGGTSSAIGVSSATAPHETKGDLLGGAGGDVAATLAAANGNVGGTIGASFGSNGIVVLPAAAILRLDRIVDAFTAGAGFVHVLARLID